MTEDLLPYYNRELSYIRRHAGRFAEAHPKVAARLRLGPDGSEDPHVERLLQGFAYLTSRVRHKLDDEFPEITQAILGVLYPHYLAPIPSCAVVQLDLDPGQNELTAGLTVPRGQTLESESIQGEPCRFRTTYPVALNPVDVRLATLASAPFTAPATPRANTALAVLRVGLGTRSPNVRFADFAGMKKIRFFLRGQPQHTQRLYELLLNHTVEVAFARGPNDKQAIAVGPEAIQPVGFARDEALLPYPARSFIGYRLLTEYFTFPQKFLFVDVTVPTAALARSDGVLEIFVYLNRQTADLEPNITADTLKLGCTPMVNLYEQPAEPIRLTQQQFEYRVVPDHRRPLAHEIYSIDRVTATAADGREAEYVPFFAVKNGGNRSAGPYWHSTRRPAADAAEPKTETTAVDRGTEVYLSFVDIGFNPAAPIDWTVSVRATCMNRDLPARLPFGGGQPKLQLTEGSGLVTRINCLTPPTPTVRTHIREEGLWRLVSHLTLNHISLTDGPDGADALREILALYDFTESAVSRAAIEGIRGVTGKRVLGRANGAVCRGVEVGIEFDEDRYTGNGMYLFASVLDRFFTLYASVNTFTRTVATVARREGVFKRFPSRAGDQIVL
jgi:type VI secretion system protein ImpG